MKKVPLIGLLFFYITAVGAPTALAGTATEIPATQTAETQAAMTPREALNLLKEGNTRFTAGQSSSRDLMEQVEITAAGQFPHSIVLSCIDSRTPPELLFDQGLGDIFSIRIAGNFVNTDILGSMEFAAAVAGSKAIVVLGHTECGAVKGACDNVEMGNLTHTLSNIAPALYTVSQIEGNRDSSNPDFVNAVAHENVRLTVANILERSPILQELVAKGELEVVGAMYDVASGKVHFLDS